MATNNGDFPLLNGTSDAQAKKLTKNDGSHVAAVCRVFLHYSLSLSGVVIAAGLPRSRPTSMFLIKNTLNVLSLQSYLQTHASRSPATWPLLHNVCPHWRRLVAPPVSTKSAVGATFYLLQSTQNTLVFDQWSTKHKTQISSSVNSVTIRCKM